MTDETFDVVMSASSTTEGGRAYLVEQQRVPLPHTPIAFATSLRALMGQMHPQSAVMIDPSAFEEGAATSEPSSQGSLNPAVHEQIVGALRVFQSWAERGESYATITGEQVAQVVVALTAADALAHMVAGEGVLQAHRVRSTARVLLGEVDGIPAFREGTLDVDGDRPDGSLLVTLDPPFLRHEITGLRSADAMTQALGGILQALLRLDGDGQTHCRVCDMTSPDGKAPVEKIAEWATRHFVQDGCWQPIQQWEPEGRYVPVTRIRPGDEVRVEFQQNDGTFVDDPLDNGDRLDYGYVTDTVIQLDDGVFALADADRTRLQARDEPGTAIHGNRLRRIYLIKRGEWSSAIRGVEELKQRQTRVERDRVERVEKLRSALAVPFALSEEEHIEEVRTLRQHAMNRRVHLSRIATALGLPELTADTPISTEVETVRAILGRLQPPPDELRQVVLTQARRPGMPMTRRDASPMELVTTMADTLIAARAAGLAEVNLAPEDVATWRLTMMASAIGLYTRENADETVSIAACPFPDVAGE